MNMATSTYLPGDPRLIDQIVYELKSQGVFDQFRKECIADVDTKPAYQNLSQRVEGSVLNFLNQQTFCEDTNKNQLREQLRKSISETGFLETGVERIVDQVVNPKINTVFLPKVEDVVYRFLGIEKPSQEVKCDIKVEDLLPNDLEAVSPESVHEKREENNETNETSLNSSFNKTEEDESPPFELLEENTKFSLHEDNSVESRLSGNSGIMNQESNNSTESKDGNNHTLDVNVDIVKTLMNGDETNPLTVDSEETVRMEVDNDSSILESLEKKDNSEDSNDLIVNQDENMEAKENNALVRQKIEFPDNVSEKTNECEVKDSDKAENNHKEEKKSSDRSSRKHHDKHKSSKSDKGRRDNSEKRSRSKSESKSKDNKDSKSNTTHGSKDKDDNDHRNGKDKEDSAMKDKQSKKGEKERERSKEKRHRSKEKSEKDKSDKNRDKDKITKDKEKSEKERSHKDKEKSDKEKHRAEKDKSKSDKDKNENSKSDKDKISSNKDSKDKNSLKKEHSTKDRDKSSSSKDKISSSGKRKESSTKDKESTKHSHDKRKSSSSNSKDKDSNNSKSRSSDKNKSDKDKSSHHDKSNSKKEKDKKSVDDHYSLKDKKSERRSTDRDSNDGSGKMSRNGSFTETSNSFKGSSKESSDVFTSGSGDSSNSDKVEENPIQIETGIEDSCPVKVEAPIKYIKPKFASNIHEAMKIMKIRKQLAKLERQNQLALAHAETISNDETSEVSTSENLDEKPEGNEAKSALSTHTPETEKLNEDMQKISKTQKSPILKSHDLSMETFEALEARLAQEMSTVNCNLYGEEDDNESGSTCMSQIKKQRIDEELSTSKTNKENSEEIELTVGEEILEHRTPDSESVQKHVEGFINKSSNKQINFDDGTVEVLDRSSTLISLVPKENILVCSGGSEFENLSVQSEIDLKEGFRGFSDDEKEKNNCHIIKLSEIVSELKKNITRRTNGIHNYKNKSKLGSSRKLEISFGSAIKEVTNISPTVQDLLQKNGKKLFIKIDNFDSKLASKILVRLQDTENTVSNDCKTIKRSWELKNHCATEQNTDKVYTINKTVSQTRRHSTVMNTNSVGRYQATEKWDADDTPCYYFENSNFNNHIQILNDRIKSLENDVKRQSLQIHNNVPNPKKSRKRKADVKFDSRHPLDNLEYKKNLSETKEPTEKLCNTDVTSNQSFNLPLSPSESEQSEELKKEEAITFKPKKRSRVSTSKRYSSDDLYKPRPILSCSTTRRRGLKLGETKL